MYAQQLVEVGLPFFWYTLYSLNIYSTDYIHHKVAYSMSYLYTVPLKVLCWFLVILFNAQFCMHDVGIVMILFFSF